VASRDHRVDAGVAVRVSGIVPIGRNWRFGRRRVRYLVASQIGRFDWVSTRDFLSLTQRIAASLDAETIWINCWLLRDLRVPFGGMK